MKRSGKYIALIIIVFAVFSCTVIKEVPIQVNTRVLPLGDSVMLHEGCLLYALPQTVLDFTVIAEKTILKAGPYHEYAMQFLGLSNVITADQVFWTLKEVRINSVLEIDPEQFYIIESDGLIQTNAISMFNAGLIMDINPSVYMNRDFDKRNYSSGDELPEYRDMGSNEYYNIEQDTAYRLIDVDTAFIRIPYLLERRRQLTLEEQAENTARILLELREGRHLILTGEATVFPQDKAPIDEINRLEGQYISLFSGKSYSHEYSFDFSFVPESDMDGRPVILFRFSTDRGVLDLNDVSGRPVVIEMMGSNSMSEINIIEEVNQGAEKFDKLYYRIPEVVDIRVTDGKRNLGGKRQLIYQFGKTVRLPANYILGK